MEAELVPLNILYDFGKETYIIPARDGGYMLLDRAFTDRQVAEGIFEEVNRSPEGIVYGLTLNMRSVDLKILLTPDVVTRVLCGFVIDAVDFNAAMQEKFEVRIDPEQLPLTLTVNWSVVNFEPFVYED